MKLTSNLFLLLATFFLLFGCTSPDYYITTANVNHIIDTNTIGAQGQIPFINIDGNALETILGFDYNKDTNTLHAPNISTNFLDFNLLDGFPQQEGRLQWDNNSGTLEVGMPGGNVNLQIGQENLVRARNVSGVDINNGNIVYISGSTGNFPQVSLADADDKSSSHKVIGVATEDIGNNNFGYVTTFGLVRDLNTIAFTAGSDLYLSQTLGQFTTTIPIAPAHTVAIGHVIRSHATEGIIYVTIRGGTDLNGLDDVNVSGVSDGQVLYWDNASQLWKAKTVASSFDSNYLKLDASNDPLTGDLNSTKGFTGRYLNTDSRLDFNVQGVSQFYVGTDGDLVFPDNQKTYFGTSKDASIWYNGTDWNFNSREVGTGNFIFSGGNLGVGSDAPTQKITMRGTSAVSLLGEYIASDTGSAGILGLKARGTPASPTSPISGDNLFSIGAGGYANSTLYNYNKAFIGMRADGNWSNTSMGTYMVFEVTPSGSTTRTEKMRITTTKVDLIDDGRLDNVLAIYGNDGSLNLAGYEYGTTLSSSINFYTANGSAAGNRMTIDSDGDVGIGTATPTSSLHVVKTDEIPIYADTYASTTNYAAGVVGRRARGTTVSPSAIQKDDYLTAIFGRGYNGSAFTTSSNGIVGVLADENWNTTNNGTYINFRTTTNGATVSSEKARITNAGNMGINTTSPAFKLDVNGTARFVGDTNFDGNIWFNDTFWDDVSVSLTSSSKPGGKPPTFDEADYAWHFEDQALAVNEQYAFGGFEMPHDWKIGTSIYCHIHAHPETTNVGDYNFELSYSTTDIGEVEVAPVAITLKQTTDGTANKIFLSEFPAIDMSTKTLSNTTEFRLKRLSSAASDTYTGDVAVDSFGCHYEINSPGSREKMVK